MAVIDDSKENFVIEVPYVEKVEAQLREEERKRTGRYLAVTVVLFLVAVGLYHIISNVGSKASALVSAAAIMFLYLLWLWLAAHRRKLQQKKTELHVERQVSAVLENLSNYKNYRASFGPHDNLVYSNSEDDGDDKPLNTSAKSCNIQREEKEKEDAPVDQSSSRKSSCEIFVRTYSIA